MNLNLIPEMRVGAAGGLLCTAISVWGYDILHTAVLSAVGAAVSFTVTHLVRKLFKSNPK